jgi:hypothetical protein
MADTPSGLASGAASTAKDTVTSAFNAAQERATASINAASISIDTITNLLLTVNPLTDAISALDAVSLDFTYDAPDTFDFGELQDITDSVEAVVSTIDEIDLPVLDTLVSIPEFSALTSSIDEVRVDFIAKIKAIMVDGATGLDATVEQAIWDRALNRQEIQNLAQYNEAEKYFSTRGFEFPTGAMAGRLQEISVEIARANAGLNKDITIEQAKLAQTNFQFAIEKGAGMVLEMMKTSIEAVLSANKGKIDKFLGQVELYKQQVAKEITIIETQIKIISAKIDVFKTGVSASEIAVNVKLKENELLLTKAQAILAAKMKDADIVLDEANKVYVLQIELAKSIAQIHSQMAASAMSGINASASFGFSGGASMNEGTNFGYSWDRTAQDLRKSEIKHLSA